MITFFLGLALLMFFTAFNLYRRVMLDDYRDRLFDLRSELRDYYLRNGISMDSSHYIAMRRLLNGYIRYLEDNRFTTLVYFAHMLKKRNVNVDEIVEKLERSLKSGIPDVDIFTKSLRHKAVRITQQYMLSTSCTVLVLSLAVIPAALAQFLMDRTRNLFVLVRQSMRIKMDTRRSTSPSVIECIVANYGQKTYA